MRKIFIKWRKQKRRTKQREQHKQNRDAQMEGLSPQETEAEMRLDTWKAVSWAVKGFDA